jgi:hypothetical protein
MPILPWELRDLLHLERRDVIGATTEQRLRSSIAALSARVASHRCRHRAT